MDSCAAGTLGLRPSGHPLVPRSALRAPPGIPATASIVRTLALRRPCRTGSPRGTGIHAAPRGRAGVRAGHPANTDWLSTARRLGSESGPTGLSAGYAGRPAKRVQPYCSNRTGSEAMRWPFVFCPRQAALVARETQASPPHSPAPLSQLFLLPSCNKTRKFRTRRKRLSTAGSVAEFLSFCSRRQKKSGERPLSNACVRRRPCGRRRNNPHAERIT